MVKELMKAPRAAKYLNRRTRPGSQGSSPLESAAHFGFLKTAKFLVQSGARVNFQSPSGCTALLIAIRKR